MRKFILPFIVIGIYFESYGQNHQTPTYKQTHSEHNLEVQFSPWGSSPIGISGIRYRKFQSIARAFRLNIYAEYAIDTDITQQSPELRDTYSQFTFNIRPGVEKHLSGTDRLSPYFGFELDLAVQTSNEKSEYRNFNSSGNSAIEYERTRNQNGFFDIGANALAGIDIYIIKGLYLGLEFGYGLNYQKDMKVRTEFSDPNLNEPSPIKSGGNFSLRPNAITDLRLGYLF